MIKRVVISCVFGFLAVTVLAILFLPACACGGREGGRDAACVSNERQVGLALLQYAQDNDQQLPAGANGSGVRWAGQVQCYIKSTDTFHCPDDDTQATAPVYSVSFGYNRNIARRHGRITSFSLPAHTVILFETTGAKAQLDKPDEGASAGAKLFSAAGNGTDGSLRAGEYDSVQYDTGYLGKRPVLPKSSQFASEVGRHSNGANYLYGDGHVKWLLPVQVSSGADAASPKDTQTGGVVGRAAGTENTAYQATFSTK